MDIFSKTCTVRHICGSYQLISLILNSKQGKTTFYLVFNFEENHSQFVTERMPRRKVPYGRHDVIDFKMLKPDKNGPCEYPSIHPFGLQRFHTHKGAHTYIQTDRQTDRQTHTHTHTHRHTDTHKTYIIYKFVLSVCLSVCLYVCHDKHLIF